MINPLSLEGLGGLVYQGRGNDLFVSCGRQPGGGKGEEGDGRGPGQTGAPHNRKIAAKFCKNHSTVDCDVIDVFIIFFLNDYKKKDSLPHP